MELLVHHYRKLRENDVGAGGKTSYRMTVRQLESMIRLSEARARIHCDEEVTSSHLLLLIFYCILIDYLYLQLILK
jgi:DNA replication licensing factor MCM6